MVYQSCVNLTSWHFSHDGTMHNMVSHMDTYYHSHQNVKPDDLLVIILYPCLSCIPEVVSTLRPRQHGRHFADDSFKRIFLSENIRISIKISLKFVHTGPINNVPALVQIMAWRRPGDKPLSEPMLGSLLTHICVTRPQWVKCIKFAKMQTCYLREVRKEKRQMAYLKLVIDRLPMDTSSGRPHHCDHKRDFLMFPIATITHTSPLTRQPTSIDTKASQTSHENLTKTFIHFQFQLFAHLPLWTPASW